MTGVQDAVLLKEICDWRGSRQVGDSNVLHVLKAGRKNYGHASTTWRADQGPCELMSA